jgi:hypothetical protein
MQDGEQQEGYITINSTPDVCSGYVQEVELGFAGLRN